MATGREAAQAEVVKLREALAQAEQARASTLATFEVELAAVRETLAKTERQAEQRAAAVAALQDDVVSLQGRLTTAQEVGRAAIDALRSTLRYR